MRSLRVLLCLAAFPSLSGIANVLESSTITLVDSQYNSSTYAATNLLDGDPNTLWLSGQQTNNINFQLNNNDAAVCVAEFELTNYGVDSSSVNQFMLLTASNSALNEDSGTTGWRPLVAEQEPTDKLDYLSWAQGARLVSVDSQYNTTSYSADNLNDGNSNSKWLSTKSNNTIEYNFDTDWNGYAGDGIPISEIEVTNYGNNAVSVKQFQVEVTTDGVTWSKLEVPGSVAGDEEYIFTRRQDGGVLGNIDSQYNTTSYSAAKLHDGDSNTYWLSTKGNNTIEFTFDPNNNGTTGAEGDTGDLFTFDKFNIKNNGNDASVNQFQIAVQTLSNPDWQKIGVPGAVVGEADYNFALSHHGASLTHIDSQYNTTTYSAAKIHDGDTNSYWLSNKANNTLEFQFDVDENGEFATASDYFSFDSFYIQNYGADDAAINEFQIAVKTASNPVWQKINVPGAVSGEANFNFALSHSGGTLTSIDSQYNTTSYSAAKLHDGDPNTYWLSNKGNNTLEFQFDVDGDGVLGGAGDLFTLESFYLQNRGVDNFSINEFQVAVKTLSNPNWQKISVPGSVVGESDYNFALAQHGGTLVNIDSQYNSTSYAAANLHDGDDNSKWLSNKSNNTLDFQFDLDDDGSFGGSSDRFKLESFHLVNYGLDDISIKYFQVEVKTLANSVWTKLPVPGTAAGDADYNFSLAANGGSLTTIDSEYNSSSYAADNLHDGDQNSRWLSTKQDNTLAFAFDTDNDGVSGDTINLDTISLINYGNNDISIQTFEIDIKIVHGKSTPSWQTINAPDGGTVFTALNNSELQTWAIDSYRKVSAVRIRTLSNYGSSQYIGANELTFSGTSVSPSHTFTAGRHSNGETFNIEAANQPENVTDVRLRTITNHGSSSYIGAKEFKLIGLSTTENKTFTAAMHGNGETFTLDAEDIAVDVTHVKLITINNHGNGAYIGANEFKLLGNSITESNIFTAAMHGNGETFTLDAEDIPVDVTDVKLITISNHGDAGYIGAREFQLLGDSVTETKTFNAAMHDDGETFFLDVDDIPVDVTVVKLITINTHGDSSYIGLKEFEVVGESVTPSRTFTVPMTASPYSIVLDAEDQVTDIVGVRIETIQNHGDPSYIGMAEFKLFGTAITPSYIFTAENTNELQTYDFDPVGANILRFHSLNNYGTSPYTRAVDFGLNEGVCKTAQWRMDEFSWSGAAAEVVDSSAGGYDGVSVGYGVGVDPYTSDEFPALLGDGDIGTCHYGEFDGVDDYVVSNGGDYLDDLSAMTFSAWIKASSFSQSNGSDSRGVFSQGPLRGDEISYGAFFLNSGGNRLYVDIDGSNDRFASNTVFTTDTWYHITIVFDGSQASTERVKLYVNGVLDGTFSETSEVIPDTNGDFYIGNAYSAANAKKVFHGAIDEVNLKPIALTAAEVVELMETTRSCTVPVHHIEIEHDGSGLTCLAEPLTLKACADATCSTLTPSDVVVSLSASGVDSIWSNNPITIPGGSVATVDLSHTTAETVTLSATTDLPTMASLQCDPNCDIAFAAAGYLLSLDNHNACSDTNLTIQAVKLDDTQTSCVAARSGDIDVDLVFNYANPSTGSKVPSLDSTPMEAATVSQSRTITFDNSGTAVLNFEYQDAGKISISVAENEQFGLASASVTAVVSPDKLIVAATDENGQCTSNDASCSVFKQAGEVFDLSLSAVCSDGTVTPNFRMDNIPLSVDTVAPLTGNSVSLGVSSVSFVARDYGVHSDSNQSISEVGVFTITATPPAESYFGETIAPATSESIGRFTPAYFDLDIVFDGFLSGGDPFVYSGQMNSANPALGQIRYSTEPEFIITPKNVSGQGTLNYTGDFMKLVEDSIVRVTPTEDLVQLGADAINKLGLTASLSPATLTESGSVVSYQFSSDDHFVYSREANALVAPFTSQIGLQITSVIDTDGIVANDYDTDDSNGVLQLKPYGKEIRFGRWTLKNSFGPETADLYIPMVIQYWNGSKFVTNSLDNFTSIDADDASITDISLAPASTTVSGSGFFNMGLGEIILSAPGVNHQGEVQLEFAVPNWLQYDWSNADGGFNGPYSENPEAIATFGIFRGNDRMMHWHEASN